MEFFPDLFTAFRCGVNKLSTQGGAAFFVPLPINLPAFPVQVVRVVVVAVTFNPVESALTGVILPGAGVNIGVCRKDKVFAVCGGNHRVQWQGFKIVTGFHTG
jgi:hypothetical protein